MIGLLRSEALRFRSRRLFVALFVLAALGAVVGVTIASVHSSKPSSAEVAQAEQRYHETLSACIGGHVTSPSDAAEGVSPSEFCRRFIHLTDFYPSGTLELARLPTLLENTAFLVIVLALVIGASSTGADWQSGTFGSVLGWEPRRARVLAARALVVAAGVLAISLALDAILGLLMCMGALVRGSTLLPGGWVGDVVGTAVRISLAAVAAALLGVAVSMIGRTTAATLAGSFVYFAVFESLVRAFLPSLAPYLLATNVVVWVLGHAASPGTQMAITPPHAHAVVIGYVIGLLGLAFVVFDRREVTA
jgi:ABC-2 family transporter protein